jgi:hypothetical protein
MTMIGIAAHEDHAEILTDSIAYSSNGMATWTVPGKITHLPGITAAVVTQGTLMFRDLWHEAMRVAAAETADFDRFTEAAEAVLPAAHEHVVKSTAAEGVDIDHDGGIEVQFAAFHIGWSPDAGRFVAYGYDTETGLRRLELDGLYLMPAPLDHRPGPVEAARVAAAGHDVAAWTARPPARIPDGAAAWVELAKTAHRSRSLDCTVDSGLKVYTGGDVRLARLTRDGMTEQVVHSFIDPDEFARMVAGTLHPLGQLAPCPCGNGKTLIDCILPNAGPMPCDCGSGRPFGGCCSVYAQDRTGRLNLYSRAG